MKTKVKSPDELNADLNNKLITIFKTYANKHKHSFKLAGATQHIVAELIYKSLAIPNNSIDGYIVSTKQILKKALQLEVMIQALEDADKRKVSLPGIHDSKLSKMIRDKDSEAIELFLKDDYFLPLNTLSKLEDCISVEKSRNFRENIKKSIMLCNELLLKNFPENQAPKIKQVLENIENYKNNLSLIETKNLSFPRKETTAAIRARAKLMLKNTLLEAFDSLIEINNQDMDEYRNVLFQARYYNSKLENAIDGDAINKLVDKIHIDQLKLPIERKTRTNTSSFDRMLLTCLKICGEMPTANFIKHHAIDDTSSDISESKFQKPSYGREYLSRAALDKHLETSRETEDDESFDIASDRTEIEFPDESSQYNP